MDVDNSTENQQTGGIDIEQGLLQQFSCMGTTDREELVQQLQKLLGNDLDYSTAVFFLDMNNWNLQAAICSYLDVDQLPSMSLIPDPVASEMESVEPNTKFEKIWHICNNGTDTWPGGCYAQCSDGNNLGATRVPIPCLKPGESTHLTIEMFSPSTAGMYQSKWRLCSPRGAYFGDPMWAIVAVVEEGTMALTQQLSHFNELGASPPANVVHNPFIPQRINVNCQSNVPPPKDMDPKMC